MGVLPAETGGTRTLNVFLPFLVALEPYLFNLMGYSSILIDVVTVAYALDIGTIYAILAGLNGILSSKGRGLVEPALICKYRAIRNLQILVAMVFWVSILPQFYTVGLTVRALTIPLRFLFWILTIGISRGTWILRRAGRL